MIGALTVLAACASTTPKSKPSVPSSLVGVFALLDSALPPATRGMLRATRPEDEDAFHFSLGMWLRNNAGLWSGGPIRDSMSAHGLRHADDMSHVVLEAYVFYLNDQPIKELSATNDTRFFARGLTEDLMTELAMLAPDRLGVIGPASIRRIVAADSDVGTRLGTAYSVRGAVREDSGKRRTTVRLEDSRSGSPVWGQRYDRAVGQDDMALQASIARDIAKALSIQVLGEPRSDRLSDLRPAIQESLLVARWLIDRSDSTDVRRGVARLNALRTAIPEFAPLWAFAARGLVRLGDWSEAESRCAPGHRAGSATCRGVFPTGPGIDVRLSNRRGAVGLPARRRAGAGNRAISPIIGAFPCQRAAIR